MIGNRKYQKKSKKGNSQNNRNQKRNQNRSKNNRNNQNRNNQNRNQRMNNMNQNRSVTQTKKRSSAKAKRKNRSRRRSMTASQKKRLMANLNRQMNRKKVRKSANKNQRRKRYSKQRGGFMAGLGGPADVPQFCDAQGHAVADLLGAKAANAVRAAGGNEEAQEAAAQNVINQQEGDVKKCDKPLNFLKDAERLVSDDFDKITDLGIQQQYDYDDSAPNPTDLGLQQSIYADERAADNSARSIDSVRAWSRVNDLDREYSRLKTSFERGDDLSTDELNELNDLQYGTNTYGPNQDQTIPGEYARQRELNRLWNAIPQDQQTSLNAALGNPGGPHPQGDAATIPALTRPA